MKIDQMKTVLVEKKGSTAEHRVINRSKFDGVEQVRISRKIDKSQEPVLFTSFLPVNEVLSKKNTSIITAIGHGFLQLPFTPDEYTKACEDINQLNEIQLKDIILNFCQLRSSVRESFHAFKGILREIKNRKISIDEKDKLYKEEFKKYEEKLNKEVGDFPELLAEYKRVISFYNKDKEDSIELIEAEQEENFVRFLPEERSETVQPEPANNKNKFWKVLFLDDRPDELNPIIATLEQRGISSVIAKTAAEAKEKIIGDEKNNITVVVSDYRLFEHDNKGWAEARMQKEQGYDFLKWLSLQDRFNMMIALSGLSKRFLMESFRKEQLNIKVYSKNGLLGGGVKLFADDIEHYGERVYETLISLPKAAEWKKQFLRHYKWLKLDSVESDKIEHNISNKALSIINQLDKQIESNETHYHLKDNFGNTQTTISPKKPIEDQLNIFILKMAHRRVVTYYLIRQTINPVSIAKIISKGSVDAIKAERKNKRDKLDDINRREQGKDYDGDKKQVFRHLAILEGEPTNILVEEKNWFRNIMGIDINMSSNDISVNSLYEIMRFYFRIAREKYPIFAEMEKFNNSFESGRTTKAINKDLEQFLRQLDNIDSELLTEFLQKMYDSLVHAEPLTRPQRSIEMIKTTIEKYLYR